MKFFHSMTFRIFVYFDDDYFEIKESLSNLLKTVQEPKKIVIEEQTAKGFDDNKIVILKTTLTKSVQINELVKKITKETNLKTELENRLSDDLNIYLRLKKDEFTNNEFKLTDSGDCVHITISVAAYPKTIESAKNSIKEFVESKLL